MSFPNRIPVTIITGFLGSGKTTLLRKLLINSQEKLGVMVNEFGSVGIDGDLFKSCGFCSGEELDGRLVELNNGCICCTVQDDFLPALNNLLLPTRRLAGIVIETSGLALPKPLIQALSWPSIKAKVYLNGVVTVVDGEALSKGSPIGDLSAFDNQRSEDKSIDHLTPLDELFNNQLDAADVILISRADLLGKALIKSIKLNIESKVKSTIPIFPISCGEIDSSIVLGINRSSEEYESKDKEHKHDHHHLEVINNSIRHECKIEQNNLRELLTSIAVDFQIIRLKGRFWLAGKDLPLQVQMVGQRFDCWFEKVPPSSWKPRISGLDLVVISFRDGVVEEIQNTFK
ncbi:GTP-binding protein [Prochlorococcus sp. MIT 1223]|uniref:GTP-binding protein n=1 Tax=Prochlorococcus sp. MIT 1223 TaxID=3096217 RepID=UPI002A74EE3A|nr:GTP-binding protein [Prochlorococcus sp. MIT 1223]